jgi:DNA-binding Lrp family transcriptional regulator
MKKIKNVNYNERVKNADMIFGGLAIFCSLLAPIGFFIAAVFAGITSDGWSEGWSAFGRIFLGGILFTFTWGVLGARAFIRVARAERYSALFGASLRVKIADVANSFGLSLNGVSSELTVLKKRGYFKKMEFDLDAKEISFSDDIIVLGDSDSKSKTVYKERSGLPLWPIFVTFSTFFSFWSLENWSLSSMPMFIFGVVMATIATVLAFKFFPTPVYWSEVKRNGTPKRPAATGHSDLDGMLAGIYANKCEIVRLSESIESPKIREPLREILQTLDQITEYVTENPGKAGKLRQFANYYLPTTVDLLKNYEELAAKPDSLKGDNIKEAMAKIEDVTANMTAAFKREYDDLFVDRVMDISAEVSVMQSIIKESKGI